MNFFIYIIQNKINNKIYIGKSNDTKVRWRYHKKVANGGREKYPNDFFAIHGSLIKYGFDKFLWDTIEEFDNEQDCLEAETFWIQYFRSWDRNYGYNLNMGGGNSLPSSETKLKMSLAQTGSKHSQAKLNEEKVLEIIKLYKTGNYSQIALGKMFGVSGGTIGDIFRHKGWTHLTASYVHNPPKLPGRKGEKAGASKLKESEAINAIKLYNSVNYNYQEIANMFNVKKYTIYAIIKGTNWKHLKRDY